MPAVRPETTTTHDEGVHRARDADGGALHAAGQSSLVACFDDEMHVIPLHGKVQDPETLWRAPTGARQSDTHAREDMLTTERAKEGTQRDVNRVANRVTRANAMRHIRA